MLRCLPFILLLCMVPAWGAGAADAGEALLQTDQTFNRHIMARGNDVDSGLGAIDHTTMGLSHHRWVKSWDVFHSVPRGPSPGNHLTLYTKYAAVSADGELGVTYGVWNAQYFDTRINQKSDLVYGYFVLGFDSGLWAATWSPWGAPRFLYHEYIRIWHRDAATGGWRLALGHVTVERLSAPAAGSATQAVVLPLSSASVGLSTQAARRAALDGDKSFSRTSSSRGGLAAYTQFGAADMRMLREFDVTAVGLDAMRANYVRQDIVFELVPVGVCATGGDVVCTYGYLQQADEKGALSLVGAYVHIWQPTAKGWKLKIAYQHIF